MAMIYEALKNKFCGIKKSTGDNCWAHKSRWLKHICQYDKNYVINTAMCVLSHFTIKILISKKGYDTNSKIYKLIQGITSKDSYTITRGSKVSIILWNILVWVLVIWLCFGNNDHIGDISYLKFLTIHGIDCVLI